MDPLADDIAFNRAYLMDYWAAPITEARFRHGFASLWGEETFLRFLADISGDANLAEPFQTIVAVLRHVFDAVGHAPTQVLRQWLLSQESVQPWVDLIAEVAAEVGGRGPIWIHAYLESLPITWRKGRFTRETTRGGLPLRPTMAMLQRAMR